MSPANLTIVSDNASTALTPVATEALRDRVKRLQNEARGIAREHVMALEHALVAVTQLAAEIADGGDAYPVGAREVARQLVGECAGRASTLDAILSRTARP
ncbi:hypothetical protein [Caulobacter mirabilis]|uniref:Uncharacterized protein n=1 Tax=Caulobacter mirabilis TaxID=69666 RepID=A0A2D2AU13_9CAUL|nr:hypothetical protein [Caulobacter mirabilis]ATQ41491.1 hypothetical protein CSW64_03215 [Caulobacter mirabilis]